MVEYLNELRESCIEGYTGIVQGLSSDASKCVHENTFLVLVVFILTLLVL